jgi:hypothetical protein
LLSQILQAAGGSSGGIFTISPTAFTVKDGIVSYDRMDMTFANKTVTFAGQIGLDQTLNMQVTVPYQLSGSNLTVPLKGTLAKPEVDFGQLLQKELENQIKNQLQNLFK